MRAFARAAANEILCGEAQAIELLVGQHVRLGLDHADRDDHVELACDRCSELRYACRWQRAGDRLGRCRCGRQHGDRADAEAQQPKEDVEHGQGVIHRIRLGSRALQPLDAHQSPRRGRASVDGLRSRRRAGAD
ncbi:MAG TPA: hypothetical protein VEX14_16690 [Burkholderiaceae bacterium]|nr:hypothetical protein [Burkholderiaceae bacterium]